MVTALTLAKVFHLFLSRRNGLVAMRNKKFEYKMYFGGPNNAGTKWNGYESYWNNGTTALGSLVAAKGISLNLFV